MLIYIGKGSYRHGIPARDLTDEEVKQFGGEKALLATGLYEKPKASSTKASSGPAENKSGE